IERTFHKDSLEIQNLAEEAQKNQMHVILGSVPWKEAAGVFNAMLWISPRGEIRIPYKKTHLFDVDVEGHKPVRESDDFVHGEGPQVIHVEGWKIGLSICYDLRFAELYISYSRIPVDMILIPSAFLVPTGEAHWHILNRARAIES